MARSATGVVRVAAIPILAWPIQDYSNHPAAARGCGCPSLIQRRGAFLPSFTIETNRLSTARECCWSRKTLPRRNWPQCWRYSCPLRD